MQYSLTGIVMGSKHGKYFVKILKTPFIVWRYTETVRIKYYSFKATFDMHMRISYLEMLTVNRLYKRTLASGSNMVGKS